MKAEMDRFIDLVEGTLPEQEARALQAKIDADPELKRAYVEYCAVIDAEQMLAAQQHQVNANFTVKVMQNLEERSALPFFKRLFMVLRMNKPIALGAVATCMLAVFVLRSTRGTFFSAPTIVDEKPAATAAGTKLGADKKEDLLERFERDRSKLEAAQPAVMAPQEKDQIAQAQKPEANLPKEKNSASSLPSDLAGSGGEGAQIQDYEARTAEIFRKQLERMATTAKPAEPNVDDSGAADSAKVEDYRRHNSSDASALQLDEFELGSAAKIAPPSSGSAVARAGGNEYVLEGEQWKERQKTAAVTGQLGVGAVSAPQPIERYGRAINDQEILPVPESRETYVNPGEAKRLNVTHDPVSTFSIDVDTGSYTNARRFIRAGQLPPVDSVRVEEFINYFDYGYPSQTERPFGVHYEIAPSPLDKGRMLLKLGIKARDSVNSERPWNLIFLVDVSGSMADGTKLGLVKQALKILVSKMRPNDRIGIVTYAGSSGVALEPTGANERAKIEQVIDGLAAGGSTYGSGGIEAAYQLAQRSFIKEGVNRVILATDGDFNVGITDREQLIRLIEEKRKSGVTLTTIGVGQGNIQEATMEQLANKGNGNYFYLDSFQEARKVFETDLAGTIEVVAKDVKLQVEFNPSVVGNYRLIGYENRALKREDFNNDKIDAGEIGSGHTVTALYELTLIGSDAARDVDDLRYGEAVAKQPVIKPDSAHANELGFLKIRFKQPDGDTSTLETFPLEQAQAKKSFDAASADFRFATAVAGFGQLLRHSSYASGYSYQDIVTMAEAARGEDAHGYRREMVELVRSAALLDRR